VNEHIFAAVIANDEAEALLRVEEFDDAFAFADDLGRHSAPAAAAKAAASTAAAETAAASAVAAATIAETAASAPATVTKASAAAKAAALLITAVIAEAFFAEEIVALVAAAPAAIPLAPFIETHAPSEVSPPDPKTNALGPNGATGHGANQLTHRSAPYRKNSGRSSDSNGSGLARQAQGGLKHFSRLADGD
jgi:hypothetical protein